MGITHSYQNEAPVFSETFDQLHLVHMALSQPFDPRSQEDVPIVAEYVLQYLSDNGTERRLHPTADKLQFRYKDYRAVANQEADQGKLCKLAAVMCVEAAIADDCARQENKVFKPEIHSNPQAASALLLFAAQACMKAGVDPAAVLGGG